MDSGLQQQDAIERHRYLEVLHQFTMSQASLTSGDDICWNIAKTAMGDLGFVDCVVYLINNEGDRLIQRAAHGDKNGPAYTFTKLNSISWKKKKVKFH